MRKLRVLTLMHKAFVPPDSIEGLTFKQIAPWKTEYDVLAALEELGHEFQPVGVVDDLEVLREAIVAFKPHIVFNLLEEFHGHGGYVPYVVGYLELIRQAYTGCNPTALLLTRNKALTSRILRHQRIPMPISALFLRGRAVRRPKRLQFPLIVKSTTEHGSVGISQASFVTDDEKMKDRVAFVHEQLRTDAIVQEYIEGRELYVGVIGNRRLQTFPIWEMHFKNVADGAPLIATEKVKWDFAYQERTGIETRAAEGLTPELAAHIRRLCKRVYLHMGESGYARVDLRLTPEGKVYFLESNPNPQLAYGEDFAESAHAVGIPYERLIQRILNLGLRYQAEWNT